MNIIFLQKASDDLEEIPQPSKNRILRKILDYSEGKSADIKKLTNREEYRLRVGDYRVLFILENDTVEIHRILHRKHAY